MDNPRLDKILKAVDDIQKRHESVTTVDCSKGTELISQQVLAKRELIETIKEIKGKIKEAFGKEITQKKPLI